MQEKEKDRKLEMQNFNSEDELYKSITKEGSLGLLAYGYRGLLMWRRKRKELGEENPGEKKND